MSKISEVVDMPRSWWIKLGAETADDIIVHTKEKRLDVYGRKFDRLDPEYAKRKASGKIRRADTSSKGANLWLTGDMLSDLNVRRVTDKSVVIGWGIPESRKVVGNAERGRVITTAKNPLSKAVEKKVQKAIDRQTQKNIAKNNTVNRIKLGR